MAEPHCAVFYQPGKCRRCLDCFGGCAFNTEKIPKSRACHGNLFAVGVLGDEPAVKELGMPPKALYCHTAACPIGDGRGLVFPFWAFHQFHGRSVGNVLPYAPEDRRAPVGFGSHHLPVKALCGGPLSHGRAVRYVNRGAGCSVFPEDNKRKKWK